MCLRSVLSASCCPQYVHPRRLSPTGRHLASVLKLSKDANVEEQDPPTLQERWCGCHGNRCFCMFVCLHACGTVMGGWWKGGGTCTWLFFSHYIYLGRWSEVCCLLPLYTFSWVRNCAWTLQSTSCQQQQDSYYCYNNCYCLKYIAAQ